MRLRARDLTVDGKLTHHGRKKLIDSARRGLTNALYIIEFGPHDPQHLAAAFIDASVALIRIGDLDQDGKAKELAIVWIEREQAEAIE